MKPESSELADLGLLSNPAFVSRQGGSGMVGAGLCFSFHKGI